MVNCKSPYEPREDSTVLETYVRQYAKGNVLDIGTGSGIQAITAAHNNKVKSVLATDVQKSTIDYCKKCIKNRKIRFIVSDLFKNVKGKFDTLENSNNRNFRRAQKPLVFDTIIFNPPYLPEELKVKDLTLEGGKKGYETIEKFLDDVNNFLKADGIILIVFSSLTKKEKVDVFIKNNLLEFELLEKRHHFFEDLYVYKIIKSEILRKLEKKKIKDVKYFSKGKRGLVYTGNYNNKKVAIKIKNPESKALLRIDNEINFLKLLNKKKIGPKLLFYDKNYLIYEFIDGEFIANYLKNNKKENIKKVIKNLMNQMFVMDKLKMNKEEMSHPQKHIIINKKNNPILIDFERSRYTIKPSNVTQFTDFLMSKEVSTILKNNNIKVNNKKIINAAKIYKKRQNEKNFSNILKLIK